MSGRHVSTFTESPSGPQRIQIQDYTDICKFLLYFYNTSYERFEFHNALLQKNLCNLGSVFFEGLKMTQ